MVLPDALRDSLPPPFRIGVSPLDPADWIDVDGELAAYLGEKEVLLAQRRDAVFAAEPGTEAAQGELRDLLAAHLPQRFPETYRRVSDTIEIVPAGRHVRLLDDVPLVAAARLVQEDLVLLRKDAAHWRIVAAALCFPSAWRLGDKVGLPMHEVHGPVPGFDAGTRNAGMIERMFDHLRPETPVKRWNWSLFGDARLHHPESSHTTGPRFGAAAETAFLRLERQTLRRLPQSGDIVFTIRIYVDPLAALAASLDGRAVAEKMRRQLADLTPAEAAYKGLDADRERLEARLRSIAAG